MVTSGSRPFRLFGDDLWLALAPARSYRRLLAGAGEVTLGAMLRRPAIVLLVIGVMIPIMAVQRVTALDVATAALSWMFVVVLQALIGLALIAPARGRDVDIIRALDLWFAGHVPYGVWLLTTALAAANSRWLLPLEIVIGAALLPAAWTAVIVAAFCRTVLNASPSRARHLAAAHQVVVWAIVLTYAAYASGGWFRLLPA